MVIAQGGGCVHSGVCGCICMDTPIGGYVPCTCQWEHLPVEAYINTGMSLCQHCLLHLCYMTSLVYYLTCTSTSSQIQPSHFFPNFKCMTVEIESHKPTFLYVYKPFKLWWHGSLVPRLPQYVFSMLHAEKLRVTSKKTEGACMGMRLVAWLMKHYSTQPSARCTIYCKQHQVSNV